MFIRNVMNRPSGLDIATRRVQLAGSAELVVGSDSSLKLILQVAGYLNVRLQEPLSWHTVATITPGGFLKSCCTALQVGEDSNGTIGYVIFHDILALSKIVSSFLGQQQR
jgi:hypothetical protein